MLSSLLENSRPQLAKEDVYIRVGEKNCLPPGGLCKGDRPPARFFVRLGQTGGHDFQHWYQATGMKYTKPAISETDNCSSNYREQYSLKNISFMYEIES